ncbi:MAG: recombinase-like helix-turn-helix domain-containing protein [Burkholderiales bacterium]
MAEVGPMLMHTPAANPTGLVRDFNPFLQPFIEHKRSETAGRGQIFGAEERALIVWQTRPAAPSDFELTLAAALEQIFAQKIYELPQIVAALNRDGVRARDGRAWTEESFVATFRELGKLAFG